MFDIHGEMVPETGNAIIGGVCVACSLRDNITVDGGEFKESGTVVTRPL